MLYSSPGGIPHQEYHIHECGMLVNNSLRTKVRHRAGKSTHEMEEMKALEKGLGCWWGEVVGGKILIPTCRHMCTQSVKRDPG